MRTGADPGSNPGQAFARKTLWSCFSAGRLVLGSIVNAAADGKRLRTIDAFGDLESFGRRAGELPNYSGFAGR
jgi:hypothetical protein